MRRGFLRFLLVLIFCLGLCVTAYAGFVLADPNQFPYPEDTASYAGEVSDCWADVLFLGWMQAGDANNTFLVMAQDLSKLVNTSSVINAQQKNALYFSFGEEEPIWSGQVNGSEINYNANADRIKITLRINDAALQSAVGDSYSEIRDILLTSSWLRREGKNWGGTCIAPRSVVIPD